METVLDTFLAKLQAAIDEALTGGATLGQVARVSCLGMGSLFGAKHAEDPDNDARFKGTQALHKASEALEDVIAAGE